MDRILNKYIDAGIVDLIYFPGTVQQLPAYNDCLARFREESKYIAFIDADEFLIPIKDVNVANLVDEIIEGYRSKDLGVAGLGVNWKVYGWGGYSSRPEGLVIENYLHVQNSPRDNHIKSIVDPRKVNMFPNPHFCSYIEQYYTIDETGRKLSGPFNNRQPRDKIRINHYYYKSEEDFKGRIERKRSDMLRTTEQMISTINSELAELRNSDKEYDPIMLRYVDRVKEEIQRFS